MRLIHPGKAVRRLSRIFLLENYSWFRQALADMLEREPDLEVVGEAGSVEEARQGTRDKAQETFCCPTA